MRDDEGRGGRGGKKDDKEKGAGRRTFFRRRRVCLAALRAGAADLSIRKSSRFFPALIAAVNQRGCAPRPARARRERRIIFIGEF